MACRLLGAKPLYEPMLYYCQLDHWEQNSIKLYSKFKHFLSRKPIWKYRPENVGHFVSASICFNTLGPSDAFMSVDWVIIGSGNGLSPVRYQAIAWSKAELLSIRP